MSEHTTEQFYKKIGFKNHIEFFAEVYSDNLIHFYKYENGLLENNDFNSIFAKEMLMRRTGRTTFALISAIVELLNDNSISYCVIERHYNGNSTAYVNLIQTLMDLYSPGEFNVYGLSLSLYHSQINIESNDGSYFKEMIIEAKSHISPVSIVSKKYFNSETIFDELSITDYFEFLKPEAQEIILLNMEKF